MISLLGTSKKATVITRKIKKIKKKKSKYVLFEINIHKITLPCDLPQFEIFIAGKKNESIFLKAVIGPVPFSADV